MSNYYALGIEESFEDPSWSDCWIDEEADYEFWLEEINKSGNFNESFVEDILYAVAYECLTPKEYELLRAQSPIIQEHELIYACKMLEGPLLERDDEILKVLPESFVDLIEQGLSPSQALKEYENAIAQANQVTELGITYKDLKKQYLNQ